MPGFLKGLGIYTNYTYTRSKAEGVFNSDGDLRSNVPLPGTAPNLFNAGGLYAFDLDGKIIRKSIELKRPNKIEVFTGETERDPMGLALYTRPSDNKIFAVVGRKSGPATSYHWQYELMGSGNEVSGNVVPKFGEFSGKKEIEAIAVDNEMGYIYYSVERFGIRKYFADPDKKDDKELAVFAKTGFRADHEGISIYKTGKTTGYILVSNQQADTFMVYARVGINTDPHQLIAEIPVSTIASGGNEVTHLNMGSKFPKGLFVAMSEGRVFHYYD